MSDIYQKAKKQGLQLCPAEVGPQLRLQYADQPAGEWLVIAMEPIKDSVGGLSVFFVGHGGVDRWLDAYDGEPDYVWHADGRFVFVRRKSSDLKKLDTPSKTLLSESQVRKIVREELVDILKKGIK